ncbi:PPCDC (predicted) [Pycnogonum litorale]
MKVLIGCTGSVASVKVPQLVDLLLKESVSVKVIITEHSKHFFDVNEIQNKGVVVYSESDEWDTWNRIGDPVLHVELRKWADLFVVAPTDANTMAKMANGICDNLLTCAIRAWDCSKPLLFCPAMNTYMWDHPLTGKHRVILAELGYREIPCTSKKLACGDVGLGAMASVTDIVSAILEYN